MELKDPVGLAGRDYEADIERGKIREFAPAIVWMRCDFNILKGI